MKKGKENKLCLLGEKFYHRGGERRRDWKDLLGSVFQSWEDVGVRRGRERHGDFYS